MIDELSAGSRSIQEAINEGLLVDVTEVANKVGMPYRTLMTSTLVEKYRTDPKNSLESELKNASMAYSFIFGHDLYGPIRSDSVTYILEPHEEFGHVWLILDAESMKTLDLKRTTGALVEYAM